MDDQELSGTRRGPLTDVCVVEVGGIGPVPFAAMLLADLGADVVRIDRPFDELAGTHAVLLRGRRSLVLDLKTDDGLAAVLRLVERSDVLLEGFRPGVAERLGFGPDVALSRNPRLVYGRMTGWGQDGPYAALAGHDITYLAISGVLDAFVGEDGRPVPPLNLLGDFGGGGALLGLGVLAGVLHARATGEGQVVDAAIVDGVAAMTAMQQSLIASGAWSRPRGQNLFDGGAPFYRCYRTRDDRWMAVGAIEPVFYDRLLQGLGLLGGELPGVQPGAQMDTGAWAATSRVLADRFALRTRDEWVAVFAELDACVAPVLTLQEARHDPHLAARHTYGAGSPVHPAAVPRFSVTPGRRRDESGAPRTKPDEPLQPRPSASTD
jgi:alpha-methylacyl-CoA racemase